jgi:DNA repair exonuclease SbcCD nuclease subunit
VSKLLFFSDLHCHNHSQFSTILANGRNSRLQDCLNIILQAQQVAADLHCDGHKVSVFMLGDLFHSRTKLDIDVYSGAWGYVNSLAYLFPMYLLKGNHDCYSKCGDVHSLEAFAEVCDVIDEPRRIVAGDCTLNAFPYTDDVAKLVQDIQAAEPADMLLLHQALREGAVGPYGATGHGELSVKDLPLDRYKYVFAGDYHKRQWVVPNKVHYIGSPLQLTFGEAGEFKAFTLVDTETWQVEDIPTQAPRFFVFNSVQEYETAKAAGTVRPAIDFIRVLYDEDNRKSAEQVKTECDRVQLVEESQQKAVLQRVGNEVASNDLLLLEAYVEQKAPALDMERLIAVGLEELGASE